MFFREKPGKFSCFMGVFIAILLIFFSSLFSYSRAENQFQYSRKFSQGFLDNGFLYFLLEYKVYQTRKPLWFIIPIERPPKIHYQKIFFFRFEPEEKALVRLSIIREEFPFPPGVNVGYTQFNKTDKGIVFTHPAGRNKDYQTLYDFRIWDPLKEEFWELNGDKSIKILDSDQLYQEFFGAYKSPWMDNPGVISITELKEFLGEMDEDDWGLPEDW